MRTIQVSTDVYAALWGARLPGEDSEDAILCRILKVKLPPNQKNGQNTNPHAIGFTDPRFGINLPEGFEIFRIYLGKEYRAQATGGQWKLETNGFSYPSLNQLSKAIGAKIENAWQNWYFTDDNGQRKLVSALRK